MNSKITPTVGRVMWFYPGTEDNLHYGGSEPLCAHVAAVNKPDSVNLAVCDRSGAWTTRQDVRVVQAGESSDPAKSRAVWMAQAEKLEREAGDAAAKKEPGHTLGVGKASEQMAARAEPHQKTELRTGKS